MARLVLLGLLAILCVALFGAAAQARGVVRADLSSRSDVDPGRPGAALERLLPQLAPIEVTVWEGVDVDGDGAADFANPTGKAPRTHDAFGHGHYGASRAGGARVHAGVDYAADAGQPIVAPISGFVSHIGFPYGDDPSFRYVEITNPALGYVAKVFYVEPQVMIGQPVRLGDVIGVAATLQGRYRGITDHVHLEIYGPRGRVNAERLIAARALRVAQGG